MVRRAVSALLVGCVVAVCAAPVAAAPPVNVFTTPNVNADGTVIHELPAPVRQLTLQLPGMSHHFTPPTDKHGNEMPDREFNEQNWGLGIQFERPLTGDWSLWVSKVSFGVMKDSLNAMGAYGGYTLQKRVMDEPSVSVDLGGGGFLFYRTLQFDGPHLLVPALLPVLSAEYKPMRLGVNVVAAPKCKVSGGTMPGVIYVQFTKAF
jgi:hypothetical protein